MHNSPPNQPVNILALMTDQHRIDTIACYGQPKCDTPALDGLAAQGTRFEAAFTPTAICAPARASLVTGVHPFRHGLLANSGMGMGYREELDDRFPSFAWPLQEAGYRTEHVGKWHVGESRGPEAFGFDGTHYHGWENPVDHPAYLAWLDAHGYPHYRISEEIRTTRPNGEPGNLLAAVLDQPAEASIDAYLADQAIDRLRALAATRQDDGKPFYLGLHWFGPHLPYCIPREWFDRYDPGDVELPRSFAETFANKPQVQANYAAYWGFDSISLDTWRKLIAIYRGYVAMLDTLVQRVLDAVRELGLWDSTAVFFTADHGEFTGSHRLNSKGPGMYDDIYRIPMIARIPGAPEGRVESRFASLLDLTPTMLELANTPVPEHMDGRSLVPLVHGEEAPGWRDAIVSEFHGLHFPYPQRMIRTYRYKLVVNPADINELYDLATDSDELLNRYDQPELAGIRNELLSRLHAELRQRGDGFHRWMAAMEDIDDEAAPVDRVIMR